MRSAGVRKLIRRLIEAACFVGFVATVSYGAEAHNVLRAMAPAAGAWWNAHEFYLMEGSATALGLLAAIRVGLRFAAESEPAGALAAATLVLDAVLLVPLTHLCADVARVGADGVAVAQGRMAGYAGFAAGRFLDKLLTAGVYFLKTAAFGFLLGLALFGAVLAGVIVGAGGAGSGAAEVSSADPP